jgi:hypothetical protein
MTNPLVLSFAVPGVEHVVESRLLAREPLGEPFAQHLLLIGGYIRVVQQLADPSGVSALGEGSEWRGRSNLAKFTFASGEYRAL